MAKSDRLVRPNDTGGPTLNDDGTAIENEGVPTFSEDHLLFGVDLPDNVRAYVFSMEAKIQRLYDNVFGQGGG